MLRCPLCTRIYAAHVQRCPHHGALESCDAVQLCEALEHHPAKLAPSEVLALIEAALQANSAGGAQLSPKQLYVAKGASLAFAGYAGQPLSDALDDALHDPVDVANKSASDREAYRVAALAFELFAGSPAFFAKNAKAVVVRKRLEAPPSLADARPDLPASVCALVSSALDSRATPASASGFVAALRQALVVSAPSAAPLSYAGEASLAAAPPPAPRASAPTPIASAPTAIAPLSPDLAAASAPPRRSGTGVGGVIAFVALSLLAGLTVFVNRSSREQPSQASRSHEELHGANAPLSNPAPVDQRNAQTVPVAPGRPIGATTNPAAPQAPTATNTGSSPTTTDSPRVQTRRPTSRRARSGDDAPAVPTSGTNGTTTGTTTATETPNESPSNRRAEIEPPVVARATPVNSQPQQEITAPDLPGRQGATRATPTYVAPSEPAEPNAPQHAPAQARGAAAPWILGAAISAALILCALFFWRRSRAKSSDATAPVAPEQPATRASLVATRNSITDSVQLPHPAYSQTIPASSSSGSGSVDALARTEVVDSSVPGGARSSVATQRQASDFRPFSIGPYECFEQLGEGAMGIVYKARHEKLRRLCAVKVLVPDLAERPDAAAQFRREAELAASVQHPNTVVVYDFGELEGGLLYLVMELLEGRTLETLLRERKPSQREALELVRQLSDGLDALHTAGIVHQDLKPQNVMVLDGEASARPVVKIVDFGLARLVGAEPIEAPSGARRISGTPLYMAPEQARADDRIGPSADLFALAVVAYEVLAGTAPFELDGRSVSQVVLERASGHFRAKPTGRAELDALFEHGLAADPSSRPASARDFYTKMSAAIAA